MTLTPQAEAIVNAAATMMPVPMHQIGVENLRAGMSASKQEPTAEIFETRDLEVPTQAGAVPIRLYRPADRSDLPVLMWMHGGGHAIGDLDMNDNLLRQLSNAAQIVIVSVDYRLAPEHRFPAGVDDCIAVWKWLRSASGEIAADTTVMAIGGESAGGTLTMSVSLRLRDDGADGPAAMVDFYGPADMIVSNPEFATPMLSADDCTWFWDLYVTSEEDRTNPYCMAGSAASLAGLGPALVITAGVDPVRDSVEAFGQRLADAGNDVTVSRYDGVPHGFINMLGLLPESDAAFKQAVEFLRAHLWAPAR